MTDVFILISVGNNIFDNVHHNIIYPRIINFDMTAYSKDNTFKIE